MRGRGVHRWRQELIVGRTDAVVVRTKADRSVFSLPLTAHRNENVIETNTYGDRVASW